MCANIPLFGLVSIRLFLFSLQNQVCMQKLIPIRSIILFTVYCSLCYSCNNSKPPSEDAIKEVHLKKGEVIVCGVPDKQFGDVTFETSCGESTQKDFNLAIALLHSFEYDEAEKVFAKVIDKNSSCAMAWWGVAMSNFHPLWAPPTQQELQKGAKAISIAQSLTKKSTKEAAFIEALALFYKDAEKLDHLTRCRNFEAAMEKIYAAYPKDIETATFYALSLDGAADPADKSYARQKKAGNILMALYPGQPYHPGIVHYIIHSYDYPELANLALPAARKYASIAPSSAHAQHMPSHIFTRLGLWDECINSNLVATSSAKCYAENTGIKGHWDEELHGMDYLEYAYLQQGNNKQAKAEYDYLNSITEVHPVNFKVAYAFAAIPSRYLLENKMWAEAGRLQTHNGNIDWQKYPWQKAIVHFTRLLGAVHTNNIDGANTELKEMTILYDTLMGQKDNYKANQVKIQATAGQAWILFKQGKNDQAITMMTTAADMEDKTQKHPVTPGEIIPARELLADMLLQMNRPAEALAAYEADLTTHPNRFNALYNAGVAAEAANSPEKATVLYRQLTNIAPDAVPERQELEKARAFLRKSSTLPTAHR